MQRFSGRPVLSWDWQLPPKCIAHSQGHVVFAGHLYEQPDPSGSSGDARSSLVDVVVKVLPRGTRCKAAERELVVGSVVRDLVHLCGLKHAAPLLASFPDMSSQTAMAGADWYTHGNADARVAVLVYARVPRPMKLHRLDREIPDCARRVVLLSVLAQLAVAYYVMGQVGVAHIDNHFGNILLRRLESPVAVRSYVFHDPHPKLKRHGRGVRVPIVGAQVCLIDWDLSIKHAALPDFPIFGWDQRTMSTTDGQGEALPTRGRAHEVQRWNPGEDWCRVGLMLQDPVWSFPGAWDLLGDELGAALFGAYVASHPPRHHLARSRRDGGAFYFLCARGDMDDCEPVTLPYMVQPIAALDILLGLKELTAQLQGCSGKSATWLGSCRSPAQLGLEAKPAVKVPLNGPPCSPWIRPLETAQTWLDKLGPAPPDC